MSDGVSMRISRSWTDADGAQQDDAYQRDGYFTVESLRRLLNLLEMFSAR
jgi:hypothetical protein